MEDLVARLLHHDFLKNKPKKKIYSKLNLPDFVNPAAERAKGAAAIAPAPKTIAAPTATPAAINEPFPKSN